MGQLKGVHWAPGEGPSSAISQWLQFIARKYPETSSYCGSYRHREYFPWCGGTVAYCLANSGLEPAFGASNYHRFMWAPSWLDEGDPVPTPQPGTSSSSILAAATRCHVFENDLGDGHWDASGTSPIRSSSRPLQPSVSSEFDARRSVRLHRRCWHPVSRAHGFRTALRWFLSWRGTRGPPRPRRRTSRGITQDDWDKWRVTLPGSPPDVFQAPQDQIVAIYHDDYWDAVKSVPLPMGFTACVFACGVSNGVATAARILQTHLGVAIDCDIGKNTLRPAAAFDGAMLICTLRFVSIFGCGTCGPCLYGAPTAKAGRIASAACPRRTRCRKIIGAAVSPPISLASGSFMLGPRSAHLVNQVLLELKRLDRVSSVKDRPAGSRSRRFVSARGSGGARKLV